MNHDAGEVIPEHVGPGKLEVEHVGQHVQRSIVGVLRKPPHVVHEQRADVREVREKILIVENELLVVEKGVVEEQGVAVHHQPGGDDQRVWQRREREPSDRPPVRRRCRRGLCGR